MALLTIDAPGQSQDLGLLVSARTEAVMSVFYTAYPCLVSTAVGQIYLIRQTAGKQNFNKSFPIL